MNIFIDTEFSDLSPEATLLSFGAATETGDEFYCELTGIKPENCSPFVRQNVLPLMDGGGVACGLAEFSRRLAEWLTRFQTPCLLCDSDWDIYVLRRAINGNPSRMPGMLHFPPTADGGEAWLLTLRALDGPELAAFEAAVTAHFATDRRQHHALVDARALRAGILAARSTRNSSKP